MMFPLPDERDRYIKHGHGLGYTHGERVRRETPCRIYVWPDDESVSTVTTMPGDAVTCPRCLAKRGAA